MNVKAASPSAMHHVEIKGHHGERYEEVITPEALDFLRDLHRTFTPRRQALMDARFRRKAAAEPFGFLAETKDVREDTEWRVAPAAPGLVDRRVEITGPVDAKMSINALNSGAKVWLADFEDATSPSWSNVIQGQVNLKDAIRGELTFSGDTGKEYRLDGRLADLATIVVRPRGWHLLERHILVDSSPIPAALVDFGLYFFHNAQALIEAGVGPYFYLPKLESHLEARLWNDIFVYAQARLGVPHGTIRATVLIETFPAAFEMEEILYELRDHAAGLNAGRWDYIFSAIKNLGTDPRYVFPDRVDVTMTVPFMRAYTELLVRTCHKRGAHAIGGMAAVIPSKDPDRNAEALAKVRADKEREANAGYDGSWVAHPGLVETCREAFTDLLGTEPNQVHRLREDVVPDAEALLAIDQTPGEVTRRGVETNVSVLVRYLDAWLGGLGAVAIDGLMEDAATAEISRCQLWQWIRHGTTMDDGRPVTGDLVIDLLETSLAALEADGRDARRVDAVRDLVRFGALDANLPPFVTEYAYRRYLL